MKSPRALFAAAVTLMVSAGCDVPTDPPIFEPRWIIPVDETSLEVDELLPSSVTVQGSNFDVDVDPVGTTETLGDLCPDCAPLDGAVVPVPPFQGSFLSAQSLPAEVLSTEVVGGSIDITITNGFSFDPLYDGGTIVITLSDDATGNPLGQVTLDGATETLAPNSTTQRTIVLGAQTVTGALRATVAVDAPGGQVTQIDLSEQIEIVATTTSFLIASATLDIGSRTVSLEPQEIDMEDIDEEVADRIVDGSVILEIDNPFGVAITGTLDIGSTSKTFSVNGDPTSTVVIDYTGEELRSFVGQPGITLSGSGTATGSAVTIRPGQEMTIEASLDFIIRIG